jgi:hypothetical protein
LSICAINCMIVVSVLLRRRLKGGGSKWQGAGVVAHKCLVDCVTFLHALLAKEFRKSKTYVRKPVLTLVNWCKFSSVVSRLCRIGCRK